MLKICLFFRHRTNDKQKAEDMYDEYITVIVSKVLNDERYINRLAIIQIKKMQGLNVMRL